MPQRKEGVIVESGISLPGRVEASRKGVRVTETLPGPQI